MPFDTVVAESANRNKRLDFPTLPNVPEPTVSEIGLETINERVRFPSWMENSDDPFGPDVIIPPIMFSTAASDATMSTVDASSRPNTSSSSGNSVALHQRGQSLATDSVQSTRPRPRSTIVNPSVSTRIHASLKRSVSMKPLSYPTPPTLGKETTTTLSVFGTLPDTRRSFTKRHQQATTIDDLPLARLPPALAGQTGNFVRAPQKKAISSSYGYLHTHAIPTSPFDPFGNRGEFPYDGRTANVSSSQSEGSDRVEKGLESAEENTSNSEMEDNKEPEARYKEGRPVVIGDKGGSGYECSSSVKRDEGNVLDTTPRHPSLARRCSLKVAGTLSGIRIPSVPYSFHDMQHLSLSMFRRQTFDTDSPRSNTPSSSETDSQHSHGSEYGDEIGGVLEVHMMDASRQAQEVHAPRVMSEHASPELESSPSSRIFFPVAEAASPSSNSKIQCSARKRLQKAVISKLHQLAHLKKG